MRLKPPNAAQPEPGSALVAGLGDVIEIGATRPLHQVAAGRGFVAQLRAGAGQQGAAQHPVAFANAAVGGKIAVAHHRADAQPAIAGIFDPREVKPVDVDQVHWRFDLELHQIEQIGTARDDSGVRLGGSGGGLRWRAGALIGEGLHVRYCSRPA